MFLAGLLTRYADCGLTLAVTSGGGSGTNGPFRFAVPGCRIEVMSIRTALKRLLSSTALVKGAPDKTSNDSINNEKYAIIDKTRALDIQELRSLLLQQLSPDEHLAGRPGPVQILSPFESEQQMREEMKRVEKAADTLHRTNQQLAERCSNLEGQLLKAGIQPLPFPSTPENQLMNRIAELEAENRRLTP